MSDMKQYQKQVRTMSLFSMFKVMVYKMASIVVVGADAGEKVLNAANHTAAQLEIVAKEAKDQTIINSKAGAIRAYQLMQEEFEDLNNSDINKMIKEKLKQEAETMTGE